MEEDIIVYNGRISSIRKNVDKQYIWFDIGKLEFYIDKDGIVKSNSSFFSARINRCYENKINIHLNDKVTIRGIPKGYVDKRGFRQNYIHVLEYNGISLNIDLEEKFGIDTDGTPLWDGKRCESILATKKEKDEMDQLIKSITCEANE